jgi:hypothetical protein
LEDLYMKATPVTPVTSGAREEIKS